MVLRKRKRDGEFITSTPAGQASMPSTVSELPPVKKTRTKSTKTSSMNASSSRPAPTASCDTPEARLPLRTDTLPVVSYVPSTAPDSPEAGPSQPRKAARKRKKADPDDPPPEKRGATFKKSCPQNILDRVKRVMSQRFFMIDRQREPGELKETFSVLGSTGNVYTVTIDHQPRCNCPDALKGNHCKHILFIFLKVLQVAQDSGVWYQKALLTTELEKTFAEAPLAPNALANSRIREAHARAKGKAITTPDTDSSSKKRIPGPDDDCPICYEGMHGVNENLLTFCEGCGNALHKQCFEQWRITSKNSGKQLSCVFCRARWATLSAGPFGAGGRTSREGYINLADVSGISPIRDTRTYYHGPRRGARHHGYQD
ncbi:Mitogen-activated protein kinase kinase kinase 1 [Termitomyces sp. T112]|nr:Mitogen-activated protein kinase kinase kinase 1 [Termitomyces sp. T112]